MKLKKSAIAAAAVAAILATVLFIALPQSVNLYISYIGFLIGVCLMVISAIYFDKSDIPMSYAALIQSAWFLPASLIESIIVLILQANIAISPVLHGILQLALLAVGVIKLIKVTSGKDYIHNIDEKNARNTARVQDWLNEIDTAAGEISRMEADEREEAKKAVKRVREAVRYSDPVSTEAVKSIEDEITQKIFLLKSDTNPGCITELKTDCESILALIKRRNSIILNGKSEER